VTTIKAQCDRCGEVVLAPDDIELRVDPTGATRSTYAFECTGCGDVVRKAADDRVVRLLVSGGVTLQRTASTHPEQPSTSAPTLTYDDLLDLHALLADDGWYDQLRSLVHG
jgi:hypothetical protein